MQKKSENVSTTAPDAMNFVDSSCPYLLALYDCTHLFCSLQQLLLLFAVDKLDILFVVIENAWRECLAPNEMCTIEELTALANATCEEDVQSESVIKINALFRLDSHFLQLVLGKYVLYHHAHQNVWTTRSLKKAKGRSLLRHYWSRENKGRRH